MGVHLVLTVYSPLPDLSLHLVEHALLPVQVFHDVRYVNVLHARTAVSTCRMCTQ
jgi:hypothetical protein